jgi:hypothetical protein
MAVSRKGKGRSRHARRDASACVQRKVQAACGAPCPTMEAVAVDNRPPTSSEEKEAEEAYATLIGELDSKLDLWETLLGDSERAQ